LRGEGELSGGEGGWEGGRCGLGVGRVLWAWEWRVGAEKEGIVRGGSGSWGRGQWGCLEGVIDVGGLI